MRVGRDGYVYILLHILLGRGDHQERAATV